MLCAVLAAAVLIHSRRNEREKRTVLEIAGVCFLAVGGMTAGADLLRRVWQSAEVDASQTAFAAVMAAAYSSGIALSGLLLHSAAARVLRRRN
jgi:hypothetical protein